jgi:hypothetical protein
MSLVLHGTNGITFPDDNVQAGAAINSVQYAGGTDSNQTQNTTYYLSPTGGNTDEADFSFRCPVSGTIKNLYTYAESVASGQTVTFTIRKEAGDTAVTCVITGTATEASDLVNTVAVTAGDLVTVKSVKSATTGNGAVYASFIVELS